MLTSTNTLHSAARAAAANGPAHTPTIPETGFMRQSQVLTFVPVSKATLWRRVKAGTFPAPVKLSPGVTAWRAEDLRAWIAVQGNTT